MKVPGAINLECPVCEKITLHDLKRGRISKKSKITFDSVVECKECGHVHHSIITEEKHKELPVILSTQKTSKKLTMDLPPGTRLNVGDEIMLENMNVKITGIEMENKRVGSAEVRDIKTLWCKHYEKVKLKLSINSGSRTLSRSIFAVPDEEFFIGDIVQSANDSVVIHKIKTNARVVKDGGVTARDIVRLYGRFVR